MYLRAATTVALGAMYSSNVFAGVIAPEQSLVEVLPGSQVSVLWLVQDVTTPLFGYSLDIDLVTSPIALSEVTGTVAVDAAATNFFESRNLILAAGGELDTFFTLIESDDAGGVFINTNTADFSTILPAAGVNDVLAEVVFTASADALGDFTFELGPGTALSDGAGFPVPFGGSSLTISVIPAPGGTVLCAIVGAVALRRRRS